MIFPVVLVIPPPQEVDENKGKISFMVTLKSKITAKQMYSHFPTLL